MVVALRGPKGWQAVIFVFICFLKACGIPLEIIQAKHLETAKANVQRISNANQTNEGHAYPCAS
jgi:hypothetical protein